MNRQPIIIFILLFLFINLSSNWAKDTSLKLDSISNPVQDTIIIALGNQLQKFVYHTIEPKQTIYSIARFYGLRPNDIFDYNPKIGQKIVDVGEVIRIPIPNSAILRFKPNQSTGHEYIPLVYEVRNGETLYRIARKYFRMPVDSLRYRNGIPDYSIQPGQQLHIGWMNANGIPDSLQIYGNPLVKSNFLMEESFNDGVIRQTYTEKGVAFWQKNTDLEAGLYGLHNKAPLNSVMSVTNPMTNKTVYIKVIGRIPASAYRPEENLILSAQAAQLLGAKDARLFIKLRYKK